MRTLILNRPDDWHVHFRDQDILPYTVIGTATHFARALVMPNLQPALTSAKAVKHYHQRILHTLNQLNPKPDFTPYMTLYLNEQMPPQELEELKQDSYILGAKLYPAGATTHSSEGCHSIQALYPLLEVLEHQNLVLQIHGEVTYGDIFAREALFIETYLKPMVRAFPKLRIVLEHISTKAAVDYVTDAPETVAATITPHHLLYNRNHMLVGGIKPHYYCMPILKKEDDQLAIQKAAVSGNPKFFAGTDSAPHAQLKKESACGCAGIYSAPFALAIYTEVFAKCEKLDKLNDFMSRFGAQFYQLPITKNHIEMIEKEQKIPGCLPFGTDKVIPIAAGSTLAWSVHEPT